MHAVSAACFTYTSISSCGAAKASGFACNWCYASAYCSESIFACDEGCLPGAAIYITCTELGGLIALASITGIVLIATVIFAWRRQKLLDLVGNTDVYVHTANGVATGGRAPGLSGGQRGADECRRGGGGGGGGGALQNHLQGRGR